METDYFKIEILENNKLQLYASREISKPCSGEDLYQTALFKNRIIEYENIIYGKDTALVKLPQEKYYYFGTNEYFFLCLTIENEITEIVDNCLVSDEFVYFPYGEYCVKKEFKSEYYSYEMRENKKLFKMAFKKEYISYWN